MAWAISSSLVPGMGVAVASADGETDPGALAVDPGDAGRAEGTLEPQPRSATAVRQARNRTRIGDIMRPDREPAHG